MNLLTNSIIPAAIALTGAIILTTANPIDNTEPTQAILCKPYVLTFPDEEPKDNLLDIENPDLADEVW